MPDLDDAALGGEQVNFDDGLAETLGAVFDKIQAEDAAESGSQASADDGGNEGGEAEKPAAGPARGADGKFIKAGGTDQVDPAKDAGGKPAKDQEGQDGAAGAQAAPQAPASWSAEEKAEFAKLSPDAQRIVARRESDREKAFFGKTQELAEQRKRFDRLEHVIGPRREHWLRNGMDEATAIGQLVVLGEYADRDFPGFIRHLAQARSFDLSQLMDDPADPHDDDPRYTALENEVHALKGALAERQEAETRAAQAEQDRTLQAFASDPKHPHFEAVRYEMAALMRAASAKGKSMSLDEAYSEACWANSEVRGQLQAEADEAKAAAREAEEKERARKAREAAGTRVQQRGTIPGRPAKGTWEDTMGAAYDRMSAAG